MTLHLSGGFVMKMFIRITLSLLIAFVIVGCASTNIISRQEYEGGQIARPNHIIVYDFTAGPGEAPSGSAQSAEQIDTSSRVGAKISTVLADEIQKMGLPGERATAQTQPQIGDIVIKGQLLSVDEGSAAERIALGFGSGAADLKASVAGFLVTEHGLQKLGSGTTDSSGGKTPGSALGAVGAIATANPAGLIVSTGMKVYGEDSGSSTIEGRAEDLAKEIAKVLEKKFKEQGWI